MISATTDAYVQDKGADEQSGCIEAFFDENDPTWIELGFVPFDGSVEETKKMINYGLSNLEFPEHIREMLIAWRDGGF